MSEDPVKKSTATLVIKHAVPPAARESYESWLGNIVGESRHFKGHLGINIIRPNGTSNNYTIILGFDSQENLLGWTGSEIRKNLIQRAELLISDPEELDIQPGLQFWFTPPSDKQVHAKPFKQFLVTLSAIFPLTVIVPMALQPLITGWPFLAHAFLAKFLAAVIIVLLMVYVIMPPYTRLVARWLFK